MKSIVQSWRIGFLVLVWTTFATVASADMTAMTGKPSSNRGSIKGMVAQSDLVFAGWVEEIEYALSEPAGSNGVPLPHTFVTYRVDEVFAGEAPGALVTLRFFGGLDPETMDYITTSQTPRIDIGDYDILFVQGNTKKMCPLVGNQKGRFRAISKQVYSETGRSVLLDKDGSLKHGPRYRLEDVETTSVKGRTFKTKMRNRNMRNLPSKAIDADEFKALIKKSARNVKPKKIFVSADPTSPFEGPNLEPVQPPAVEPDSKDSN
jgi:hypothetical protein